MRIAETRVAVVGLLLAAALPAAFSQTISSAFLNKKDRSALPFSPASFPYKGKAIWAHPRTLKMMRHPLIIPVPKETAAYRHTFRVLLAHPQVTDRYDEFLLKYAGAHGLDPRLLKAIIAAESEFNSDAHSPRGARGLMQLMPATAEEMGVPGRRLTDPESNIKAGAAYMDCLFAAAWKKFKLKGVRYEDAPLWVVQRVVAAYNAGPHLLQGRRRGWQPQTVDYVRKVLLFYRSPVTDIRRCPETHGLQPDVLLVRAASGASY